MTYAIYLKRFTRVMVIGLLSFTVHQPSTLFAQPNSPEVPSEPIQEQLQNLFWSWVRNTDTDMPDTLNRSIKDEQGNVVAMFIQSNLKDEDGEPFTISSGLRTTYFRGNVFWTQDSIWAYYHQAVCGVGSIQNVYVNGTVVQRTDNFRPQANCIPRGVTSIRSDRFNISIDGQVFDLDNTDIVETTDFSASPILTEAWQTFNPSNPALDDDETPSRFSVSPAVIAALQNSDNPEVTLHVRISGETLILRLSEAMVRDLQMMYSVVEN